MDREIERPMGRPPLPMPRNSTRIVASLASVVTQCAAELQRSGVLAALAFLNERSRFRYTGVYHADPPVLRNVQLFDRENPRLNVSGEVLQLGETYCNITYETNAPVTIGDALRDPRLRAHAARERFLSYGGVPIRLNNGRPWGSLCHFDVRPRLLSPAELHILEAAAPLFARWLVETGA